MTINHNRYNECSEGFPNSSAENGSTVNAYPGQELSFLGQVKKNCPADYKVHRPCLVKPEPPVYQLQLHK